MARPLRIGDEIPDFEAVDGSGARVKREVLLGRPFVLYFYPADETPGCIAEGCAFRDRWSQFKALGVDVYGVSRDSPESHRAFAANRTLPFALLADQDGRMHRAFGALMLGAFPRRISYLVDAKGAVAAVFDSHTQPAAHAEKMLEAVRDIGKQ